MPSRRSVCSHARRVPARLAFCGSTLPTVKVARRGPPLAASAISCSARPLPYISAVSMCVRPRAMPARSASISVAFWRPSAISHVPCPTTGTSSAIGPNRRFFMRYIRSMPIESVNPATGERLRVFEPHGPAAVEAKLAAAAAAFKRWSRQPVGERARVLRTAGDILKAEASTFAAVMTGEMGKLLSAAVAEAEKCAEACHYYAEHAETFLRPDVEANGRDAVFFQPLGAVLAVMPWNFPFWQVIRFAAPALAAGHVGLLKHASNVPQCALAIEQLFEEAGAPGGAFQTLLIGSEAVARILTDDRVAAATLT